MLSSSASAASESSEVARAAALHCWAPRLRKQASVISSNKRFRGLLQGVLEDELLGIKKRTLWEFQAQIRESKRARRSTVKVLLPTHCAIDRHVEILISRVPIQSSPARGISPSQGVLIRLPGVALIALSRL